jgi:formylglycine-generating enzyme required for sulfatase activity
MRWRRISCLLPGAVLVLSLASARLAAADAPAFDLVAVPEAVFSMGPRAAVDGQERQRVRVEAFRLMRREVTNAQFAAFVAASDHLTDPERKGWGYLWDGRWQRVAGADWRLRLPSEAEWELAARHPDGGRFPWGDDPPEASDGSRRANFGTVACCAPDAADGYARTAPVGSFRTGASSLGLLDMAGNVWEWTASPYREPGGQVALRGGGWGNNPYCLRVTYRHGNPPDIGLDMVGFRCASGL